MCGVFGALRHSNSKIGDKKFKQIVRKLGIEAQSRGAHATGISFNTEEGLQIVKNSVPAGEFPFIKVIPNEVDVVLGHTRHTTQGCHSKNWNNHPFLGRIEPMSKRFAFAHNGSIFNEVELELLYDMNEHYIETDSFVVVRLLEIMGDLNFDNLKEVCEDMEGDFAFTFLTETNDLYFAVGGNPLCIVDMPEIGLMVYGSTDTIVENALKKDPILYYYYKANKENKDVSRVQITKPKDGNILKYNQKTNVIEHKEFKYMPFVTTLTVNNSKTYNDYNWYRYDYSYGYGYDYDYTNIQGDIGQINEKGNYVERYQSIRNEIISAEFYDNRSVLVLNTQNNGNDLTLYFDNREQFEVFLQIFRTEGWNVAYRNYYEILDGEFNKLWGDTESKKETNQKKLNGKKQTNQKKSNGKKQTKQKSKNKVFGIF